MMENERRNQTQISEINTKPLKAYDKETPGIWTNGEIKFMQQSQSITINISPKEFIFKICPALNGSFVAHMQSGQDCTSGIIHISSQGQILAYQQMLNIQLLQIIKPDFAFIYRISNKSKIVQWNLITYEQLTITNKGRCQCKIFSNISLFSVSYLFTNHIETNYYKYPLQTNQEEPIYKLDTDFTHKFVRQKLVKLNQKGMLGLIDQEKIGNEYLYVVIQKISQNGEFEADTYRFPEKANQPTFISDIWQIQNEVIFLQLQKQEKYENYIWQYKIGKCRKALFKISENHQLQILGQFRTMIESNLPTYYVEMNRQRILAIETFDKYKMCKQHIQPLYNSQVQYFYINQTNMRGLVNNKKHEVKRKMKWQKFQQNILLTFLIDNLCDSCDGDLIEMAVRLAVKQ